MLQQCCLIYMIQMEIYVFVAGEKWQRVLILIDIMADS